MANVTEGRNEEREQNSMTKASATKIAPGPRFAEVCDDLIMHYWKHFDGGCECQEIEKYQFSSLLEEYHRDQEFVHIDDRRHAAIGFAIRRSEHYLEPAPSGAPNWQPGQLVAHRLGYDEAGVARLRLHLETLKPIYDACTPEHSAKVAELTAKAGLRAPFDPKTAEVGIRNIYRGNREDDRGCLSVGIFDEKDGSCGRIIIETDNQYLILGSGEVLDLIAALVLARKAIDENVVRLSSGH